MEEIEEVAFEFQVLADRLKELGSMEIPNTVVADRVITEAQRIAAAIELACVDIAALGVGGHGGGVAARRRH